MGDKFDAPFLLGIFFIYISLTRVHATGQERRNKPESSAAKLYCLHLQEQEARARARALLLTSLGARAQDRKSARVQEQKQERERKQEKEQEQESKREQDSKKTRERTRTRKQEREKEWQNPVPFKENSPPPRTYYSLIGCSPSAQLSSRERQNIWRENCPCTCADYVYISGEAPCYHLEHSCQHHLIMANVRAAPHNNV
jgi:flagellar biosynthesis GTPase FlhF